MKRIMNPKALAIVVGLGGLMMVGFQNCSRVDFQSMDAAALKGDTDQVTTLIDEVDETPVVDEQEPMPETPVIADNNPPTMPEEEEEQPEMPPQMPPQVQQPAPEEPKKDMPKEVPPASMPENPVMPPVVQDDPPPQQPPTTPQLSEQAKQYFSQCASKNKKGALPISAGGKIENLSGSKSFSATTLSRVGNISGNTDILKSGEGLGTIDLLSDASGTTWICGFNVKSIKNVSGNLVVVGGHIDSIDSKSGTVKLIGGSVGQITNSSGNFKFEEIN